MKNMASPRTARTANPPTAPPTIAPIGAPDESEPEPEPVEDALAGRGILVWPLLTTGLGLVMVVDFKRGLEATVELAVVVETSLAFGVAVVAVMVIGLKVRPSFSPLYVVEASIHVVTRTLSQK
jgi:hypothetical protein